MTEKIQMSEWQQDAIQRQWAMPSAPRWKRWLLVRHVRALVEYRRTRRLEKEAGIYYDRERWIAMGIWLGEEIAASPPKNKRTSELRGRYRLARQLGYSPLTSLALARMQTPSKGDES